MRIKHIIHSIVIVTSALLSSCSVPKLAQKEKEKDLPVTYHDERKLQEHHSLNLNWRNYFSDPQLAVIIDSALVHNQELLIAMKEIDISANEVEAKQGEYLPSVGVKAGAGVEKRSENTAMGALERQVEIRQGKENPDPMPDLGISVVANWEVDIWKKLRNATKSAQLRYLSSIEGRNFMVTNLVAEIANTYYELLALDQQLKIIVKNIQLQTRALEIAKVQKAATRVTELAVKKFEAELLKSESMQYHVQQQIVEKENKLNYLAGQYPKHIPRPEADFSMHSSLMTLDAGIPSELLDNRADIRQAELDVAAAELDIKVAKARFYPSVGISAGLGYQAFNPTYLLKTPQSLIYSLSGDLLAPLVNRRAIQADYKNANAKQIQAVYSYEQKLLNAYVEVANQLANYQNISQSIGYKREQVAVLNRSIEIATDLFNSAHAEYMEVLMTQRDALEARMELIEAQREQYSAKVNLYRALGGGWQSHIPTHMKR